MSCDLYRVYPLNSSDRSHCRNDSNEDDKFHVSTKIVCIHVQPKGFPLGFVTGFDDGVRHFLTGGSSSFPQALNAKTVAGTAEMSPMSGKMPMKANDPP